VVVFIVGLVVVAPIAKLLREAIIFVGMLVRKNMKEVSLKNVKLRLAGLLAREPIEIKGQLVW